MLMRLQMYVLFFCGVLLLIELINMCFIKKFSPQRKLKAKPMVSVLIPARNEEKNIEKCLKSLVKQDYDNYELLVLDDNSEDKTKEIVKDLSSKFPQIKLFAGAKLPQGWYGKHWACHQLANEAAADIILFVDADTTHQRAMLSSAVALFQEGQLDLLTAFVRQKMISLGEKLTVPFPVYSIFAILPIFVGIIFKIPSFSAVNGQFMMFKKSSYQKIGGHERFKNQAVDDVSLGRAVLKHKMRWRIYSGVDQISCRMYSSLKEAWYGFSKNYFALFNYKILVAVFVWVWMFFICWFPLLLLLTHLFFGVFSLPVLNLAVITILINTILWVIPTIFFKMPLITILLHPIIMLLASVIGFNSIITTIRNQTQWKGRTLQAPRVKWF